MTKMKKLDVDCRIYIYRILNSLYSNPKIIKCWDCKSVIAILQKALKLDASKVGILLKDPIVLKVVDGK